MSSPLRPCLPLPLPWVPLPAPRCGWSLNAISEEMLWLTTSHTSPPLPPSPPSGPPIGVCASRRNDTLPAPPSPPLTWRPHSSTNCDTHAGYEVAASTTRRSEEHTSELQSLMRTSYAVFCLKKKKYHMHK